jgi:putative ABC transport system substrate-binding protein
VTGIDPVGVGLIASLSRPGGNLTGVTDLTTELGQKQLEVLHELAPSATRVALLVNPANPNAQTLSRELRGAGRILGIEIHVVHASSERELDAAFVTAHEMRLGALVIGTDALFNSRSHQLAKLAAQYALPAIHTVREFAVAGGLMSYGGGLTDAYRQVGIYTGRILKGEKPADLPVQQSTRFELIINLKTAKILGLTVPLPLVGRADEAIE